MKLSDIIREAGAVPNGSRKRKKIQSEQRTNVSSELDGAVDDLFSTVTVSSYPADSVTNLAAPLSFAIVNSGEKDELVFDSEGNMVLQAVSAAVAPERISGEATTTVDSATCGYDFAYRKPKPTKWSADDTNRFYQALELYGSDQMLINTMLPSFTAVQIRQKFKAEMKNASQRFDRCLYAKSRTKLCAAKFEELHGTISNPVKHTQIMHIPDKPEQVAVDILDSLFAI